MNNIKKIPKLIDLSFSGCLFNKHNIEIISLQYFLKNSKHKNLTIDNYKYLQRNIITKDIEKNALEIDGIFTQ
tara:strand:+ start:1789 stop:2007 length:219 start_codon:yes stop_codon:yes gene_type:complete